MPRAKHRSPILLRSAPSTSRGRSAPSLLDDLSSISPFSALPNTAIAELSELAERRVWRTRSTILLNREFTDRIGVVSAGRLRLVAVSADAGLICLNELIEGDVLGLCTSLLDLSPGDNLRLCIDRPAEIISAPKSHFIRYMRAHTEFNDAVIRSLTQTVVDLHTRLFEVAALDVRTRLVGRLLALASSRSSLIEGAPTHAMLAAAIGASREAVSRHLADLERERLIRCRRRTIEIIDWPALDALYGRAAGGRLFRKASKV